MQATTAPAAVSPKALAKSLLQLWNEITRGHNGAVYALIDELDLTLTQVKTLSALDQSEAELSVKELAERLGLSLPSASRTVDGLLRRGWLARREDERDRRIKRLNVTPAGHDVVTRLSNARLQGLEVFAASLSDAQRRRLHAALTALPNED